MKPVHSMPVPKPRPNAGVNSPVLSDETRKFVNQIFTELQAAFPAWRQTFPDDKSLATAKVTWMKALMESSTTEQTQIAQGLRMARQSDSDFFPSVGKFISWCQTSATVPDRDTAFAMLQHYVNREFHEMPREVKAMYDMLSKSLLRNGSDGDVYRAFKRNYKFICEKLNRGESIDQYLVERLPKPKEPELSPEEKEARRLRILSEIQKTKKTLKGER
ncbi:replication protein P [Vibrio parahaemolyticus]|uniref:replication protein P n=1 Tax=Vibrio parahaemolyticus TaxID=670 RepID=UPI0030F0417D